MTGVLERRGETIHPVSQELSIESAHLEEQCGEHDLNAFLSYRKMDEILLANFHSFHSAVSDGAYDLWIADEGWEIDFYLHENPELKRAPFAWLTDFVGWLPNGADEESLTTDYTAQMLEHIDRFNHVRDRSIFVVASAASTASSANAARSAFRSVFRRWPNAAWTTAE